MRTVIVRDAMRIPLGKQGENNAVRVVWPEIAEKYAKLYGDGRFELVVVQKGKAYPAVVNVEGADLVWDVRAADVATAEVGSLELIYYVGDTIAKSQTWETLVVASKSADGMTKPPEDPARAWFDEIKRQIGDLSKLTTKAKESLVAAINEAARTGSGGGTVKMRVDGGYIQYSTDGVTWKNLIAVASLEGKPGKDGEPGEPGAPGKDGEPGKDGHTPKIAATKTGKITSITADGVEIAQIKDGEDAAADLSLGITGATVGQIAKITAVDTDGKPTKWEPVDMAGGGVEWYEVIDTETAEDVNDLIISTDKNGRPISGYHALAMVLCFMIPADSTQTSDNGNIWVYPMSSNVLSSGLRIIQNVATWKTINRTSNCLYAGSNRAIFVSGANAATVFDGSYNDVFNGVRLYIRTAGDHLPVGTKVRCLVLSKGWEA